MKKRLITVVQYLVFLGLGIFLAWWSLKDLDQTRKTQINTSLQHAKYWLIIPVFVILIAAHYIRALRWKLLIAPLGYNPRTANAFFAVLIGYLTNQAIPRLGEIVKCTFLSRYEKIPADKLIGSIILERIIDAITLLIIFGITLAIQPTLYTDLINAFFNSSKDDSKGKVSTLLIAGIVVVVVAIGILIWMAVKKKKLADVIAIFKKIGKSVWQGVSAVQHLKKRGLFLVYTVILWTLYFAGGYIGFQALQETQQYGVKEALSVLCAGSIGMIATPGGIGAYAFLIQETMQLYGLNGSIATAFGWLLWLSQTGVIIVGGIFGFIAMPMYNKRIQQQQLETA